MVAGSRLGRPGTLVAAMGIAAAFLVTGSAFIVVSSPGQDYAFLQGPILSSRYQVDSDVTIENYTAPGFTWSESVTFEFTVNSTVPTVMDVEIKSSVLQPFRDTIDVDAGLNRTAFTLQVNPLALPGRYVVNVTFTHGLGNATIVHEIWLGSNPFISYIILFVTLGFVLAIYAKVGSSKKPKASSNPSPGGTAAAAADDDTSTVTYVDQSQAPPGRIYCPECKKVIEEGSIFCPECGTRIPRYLRYHP